MTDWVMGRRALEELLKHGKDKIIKVFINKGEKLQKEKLHLLEEIERLKIDHSFVSKEELESFVHSTSHQSFVTKIKQRRLFSLMDLAEDFLAKETVRLLVVDRVFDPQNMGALIRIAECFAFDGVVFSKNRGCDITPVVTKASAGATELIPLISVSNLANALSKLKEMEFSIIVADVDPTAISVDEFTFENKTAIVFGSEGEGIQPLIKKIADHYIQVPLLGKITSLNVSQAAAIVSFFSRNIGPSKT